MRLRLRIERNALPAVQTLWPVSDTSCTVAQLLLQINAIFPLEADSWGYEDYALTLAGYELLHYHVVKDVLQNEDELVIKPLGWLDLRSRTMTGRNQISVDGRHLLDGVPFGRPALRAPTRPEVRIPPRKKRRLSQGEEVVNGSGGVAEHGGMITTGGEDEQEGLLLLKDAAEQLDEDEDEDDDDSPYNPDAVDSSEDDSDGGSSEDESDTQAVGAQAQVRRGGEGRRHSAAFITDSSSPSSSADSSSDNPSDSSSVISSSDSSSESDEESWGGITNSEPPSLEPKTKKKAPPNGHPPTTVPQSTEHASKKSSKSVNASIPGEGSSATQHRNARRRDAKRLKYAKEAGTVRQDTTLAQYRELLQKNPRSNAGEDDSQTLEADGGAEVNAASETSGPTVSAGANRSVNSTAGPQSGDAAEAPAGSGASRPGRKSKNTNVRTETPADLEERRQQLVRAIHSGGIDLDGNPINAYEDEAEAPEEVSSKDQAAALSNLNTAADMSPPSSTTRRARLDLAGSQRLLFGSLGIRVPKTQAEKDATQQKLFEKAKRKAVQRPEATNGEPDTNASAAAKSADMSDFWRDKIKLSAVECVDENVTLSEPPFPFHQRWDPQYNRKSKKRVSSTFVDDGGNKRKRANGQPLQEQYDKYNADGYGDALNYDEEEEDDEYWEEGALLNGGDEDEDVTVEDGFPELPADTATLPLLAGASDVKTGDFITFTELAVDASTGWQPQMAVRTAKVLDAASDVEAPMRIQLSNRDVKPPQYDDEGNRVYDKFEMPQEDDGSEGQDARVREVSWAELGEVRMVRKVE